MGSPCRICGPATLSGPGHRWHAAAMEEVTVAARGISQNVLVTGPADGTPVLLVHGNCSSAAFWVPLVRHLPPTLRLVAPDLRGYGRSETAPVDATRGLRDFADDVV